MGKEGDVHFADPKTFDFIQAARAESVVPVEEAGQTKRNSQALDMAYLYYSTPASLDQIGKDFGVSRQVAHYTIRKAMRDLWKHASPQTQAEFPIEEIILRKPLTKESNFARALVRKNSYAQIAKLIEAGLTIPEVMRKNNLTQEQISRRRRGLHNLGIDIPYKKRTPNDMKRLGLDLEQASDPAELRKLFKEVSVKFLRDHSKGDNRLLWPLRTAASDLYYRSGKSSLLVKALENADIPVGAVVKKFSRNGKTISQIYYFIHRSYLNRAREVFASDQQLEVFRSNPIQQICGPESPAPRLGEISKNKDRFKSPYYLLKKLQIPVATSGRVLHLENLLGENCPVAVYRCRTNVYYDKSQESELAAYFIKRYRELNSIRQI